MSDPLRSDLLQDLKDRLREIERAPRATREVVATGTGLDRLLPGRGWEAGTLIEWLSEGEGSGAMTLALVLGLPLLGQGGVLVVVDGRGEFYPPAAAGLGVPLEQTVVVRPTDPGDALWAWEQSLRSSAVALVVGWLGEMNDRVYRRLQLAAEAGGSVGFLLRPWSCRAQPAWAEARLLVEALPCEERAGRRLRVEMLHCRGGASGGKIELELSDEATNDEATSGDEASGGKAGGNQAGPVRVVSRLADPASARGAAGA